MRRPMRCVPLRRGQSNIAEIFSSTVLSLPIVRELVSHSYGESIWLWIRNGKPAALARPARTRLENLPLFGPMNASYPKWGQGVNS